MLAGCCSKISRPLLVQPVSKGPLWRSEELRGEKRRIRGKRERLWQAVVTSGEHCLAAAVGAGNSREQVSFDFMKDVCNGNDYSVYEI